MAIRQQERPSAGMDDLYSARARRAGAGQLGDPRNSAGKISFFAGFPDPASLPKADIAEATRVALERDGEWALQYGATQGFPGLIEELLKKLKRDQGIDATPANILITNGGSQAVALITDMLIDPDDVILSETPTWMGAVQTFGASGAEVREIPVDAGGTDVDALERELNALRATGRRAKLLYMIPNFQNPTGVTTTLERRRRIVALAQEHHLPLLEDDAYFDLRYAGETLPTLYTLDDSGLVMYMGTFSKIMAAGMRLGWVVATPEIIQQLAGLKHEGGTSPFAGQVAAEFCSSGTLVEHVKELRGLYHQRRDAMLATLEAAMPPGVTWTTPDGGFFIWLTLPAGASAALLLEAARQRNIEFLPGSACYFQPVGDDKIRLSYSFADEAQIRDGIGALGDMIAAQLAS
jgi:2-aminoadipate transaminase